MFSTGAASGACKGLVMRTLTLRLVSGRFRSVHASRRGPSLRNGTVACTERDTPDLGDRRQHPGPDRDQQHDETCTTRTSGTRLIGTPNHHGGTEDPD